MLTTFKLSNSKCSGDRKQWVADIRKALYASKIISYTQGYMLMRAAAKQYGWNLNNGGIALMWRSGCVTRLRVSVHSSISRYMLHGS